MILTLGPDGFLLYPSGPLFVTQMARKKDYQRHSPISHRRLYPDREMSIRIFIIDEHRSARQMLARRLTSLPDMDVVGSTCDAEEGLRQIEERHPDLVLLETKMKRADGMDICRRACSSTNGGKVAILTSYIDPEERRLAYQAGVHAYLLKEVDTPNLARWIALLLAYNGDRPGK